MSTPFERFVRLVLAIGLAIIVMAPLALMFATALKPDEIQILRDLGSIKAFYVLPQEMSLQNFIDVLSDKHLPFLRFLGNSALIVGLIVVPGIFVNSAAGFALSRLKFRGQAALLSVVVALIIIPMEALAIPLLLMVNQIGWVNTYQVQIVPFIAHPFSIYLFYQFFAKLPKDLDEAAYIDGASPLRIYWSIALPLSLPVIATVVILQSLEFWNAYLWPIMTTRGPEVQPVSLGLAQFFTGSNLPHWGDIMAFATMMSLPILIVYFAFQRWFIQSVVSSAIKG